jgi:SAM-dependent methyltransferase
VATSGNQVGKAAYFEWDVATWSQALDLWNKHVDGQLRGARALEVGGRNGGLSLWLAEQGANVVCSDLGGPSEKARALHKAHGVDHLVTYLDLDATVMTFDAEFDIVVFKSVLGGIGAVGGAEAQGEAMRRIAKALRPGGLLLFAENLHGLSLLRILRRRYVEWGGRWRYVSITELDCWVTHFQSFDRSAMGTLALLGRTERQREILGHLDRRVLDRFGGDQSRYVAVGVARKSGDLGR